MNEQNIPEEGKVIYLSKNIRRILGPINKREYMCRRKARSQRRKLGEI
jgi:hypothetical protein